MIKSEKKSQDQKFWSNWSKSQKFLLATNILIIITSIVFIIYGVSNLLSTLWRERDEGRYNEETNILIKYLQCIDMPLKPTIRQYGLYWILQNYITGTISKKAKCIGSTYCTHTRDMRFFQNLPNLTINWNGPVSVALYTPLKDFDLALSSIQYVRNCLPESDHIQKFVSFHLIIPHNLLPEQVPHGDDSPLNWPYDCNKTAPYMQISFEETMAFKLSLPYPINLLRNVARRACNTYFHISAEMYFIPIMNASNQFGEVIFNKLCRSHKSNTGKLVSMCSTLHSSEELMKTFQLLPKYINNIEEVYAVKIVLLKPDVRIPNTTILFSKEIQKGNAKIIKSLPYFYGDSLVPYFDERIYWQANKFHDHLRSYALCLLDYQLKGLDQIFWTYGDSIVYPEFLTEDRYSNKTLVQLEYDNIYGNSRSANCQKCYKNKGACI